MNPILTLDKVTKVFRMQHRYRSGLKTLIVHPFDTVRQEDRFWALNQVSFSIGKGETFGILGRNGAGKSTLLAVIAGVLRPTSGTVAIQGRISPLLELGLGFSHELTGRENILINGVLLGLRKREVVTRIDAIVHFAGLADFIDQPLKTYSSGMQSRLGFAIATHTNPDILLVDEVLSVGDAEFQQKCFRRISHLKQDGATVVFVSHNLNSLESICDRAMWIDHGTVNALGAPNEVVEQYRASVQAIAE